MAVRAAPSVLILAGGQGSRMGGADKGLVRYRGTALVDHVIRRLNLPPERIAISANRNRAFYRERAPLVFADLPEYRNCGPMAALASLASQLQPDEEWLLVVPCDTPQLPPDLAETFEAAAGGFSDCSAFYAATSVQRHFSVMYVRIRILSSAAAYLDSGRHSLQGWLRQHSARAVPFPDEAAFGNCNTPQDLENRNA